MFKYNLPPEEFNKLARGRAFVPNNIWPTVRHWSVSPTADFVITQVVHEERQFLLVKRAEPPWEGQYFIPGGRILPGETSEEACRRRVKQELGFEPQEIRFIGEQSCYNPDSPEGVDWFSLWHLYEVPVEQNTEFQLNHLNLGFKWFSWIESYWPEPICNALRMMGFSY